MNKFNKLYKLIMEDKNQEINKKIFDHIDNGRNFDDLYYWQQREIIQTMDQNIKIYGQEARGLYYNVYQFSLCALLKEFDPELFKKYQKEDWNDQDTSRKYAAQLKQKNINFPSTYVYYSDKKGEQTWQDIANEVYEYYKV